MTKGSCGIHSPIVFQNRGTVVLASEPPGIVILRDERSREYISTDKDLAARVQGFTLTDEILATFVAYEVGSSRAAVCVRLDIEEIHDDGDPTRWLHSSISNSCEIVVPSASSTGNNNNNATLFDALPVAMSSLAVTSDEQAEATSNSRRTLDFSQVDFTKSNYMVMKKTDGEEDQRETKVSSWNEENHTVEVATVWWEDPEIIKNVMRANDVRSVQRQHYLLNKWWFIPSMLNKVDYPFPCNGIIVPIPGTNKIKIVSYRVGSFIMEEDPRRCGRPLAYFFTVDENEYRSFEYSNFPCTMISVDPVLPIISAVQMTIYARGYAIVSPSSEPEFTWQAWNDQCGWMACDVGCADEMRKKDPDWVPLCHLIRFEAFSQGGRWTITNLIEIDAYLPRQINYFPTDLYFVTDVRALPNEKHPYGLPVFVSEMLEGATILAEFDHVHLGSFDCHGIFCLWALVFTTWHSGREFRAIAVATPDAWREHGHLRAMADTLILSEWTEKRKFHPVVAEPIPPE